MHIHISPRWPCTRLALVVVSLLCVLASSAVAASGSVEPTLPVTSPVWLQPPPVLALPSATGVEGPPRPLSGTPALGPSPQRTASSWLRAQNRALLSGPFPANGLVRGISDGILLSGDPTVRSFAVTRARAAGATVFRIPVDWRARASSVASGSGDLAGQADHLAAVDAAVREAVAAGLQPLLVVSRAPSFAEAQPRWPYAYAGSWSPNPIVLREFAEALARRYSGTFPDPLAPGQALPQVKLFQAWNEPNLSRYLAPQWIGVEGHWNAFSPAMYRQLLNAFYAGVKTVDPSDVVVAAGIAPSGDRAGVGRVAPLLFLSELFCLDSRGRPVAGCGEPAHFDALAYHPLSFRSPDTPAASSQDVSIADAAKVTTLLRRAERLRTVLPAATKPVWVTELDWESAPQARRGVPPRLQGGWISRALHRLWVAGVQLVDWHFLVDPYPLLSLALPNGGSVQVNRPGGLYTSSAAGILASTPKPFLTGFQLPFDPLRVDRRRVRVWALLGAAGQPATLERLRHGTWTTIAALRSDRSGVINVAVAMRGAARLRLRSGLLQRVAHVGRARAKL